MACSRVVMSAIVKVSTKAVMMAGVRVARWV